MPGMNELDEVKQEYAAGKLDKIKPDLEAFIKKNDLEIQRFSAKRKIPVDIGLRLYIVLNKTINSPREYLDQAEEMKKELWYRHEENPAIPDSNILLDWVMKHAAGWRSHRVLQIIYVYHMEKEKYLKLLETS